MYIVIRSLLNTLGGALSAVFPLGFSSACWFLVAVMCKPLLSCSNLRVYCVLPGFFLLMLMTKSFLQACRGPGEGLALFLVFLRDHFPLIS